jgi:uncharacterized protein YndB with AHSA1/START domain
MKKMETKNQAKITAEPAKQELFITREFEAPRKLVFKAFTDPKLLVRWMGPCDLTMKIDKFEAGSGGSWRFIQTDKSGREFAFHGVCHEETPPEKIIRTFEFEGLPEKGHVVLEATSFEELPAGRTKLTIQSVFLSVEDRDGMIRSGMERGVKESHEQLDMLLQELTK